MVRNLKRRVGKIEERTGISRDDEIVELPLPDGRIARTMRREFEDFVEWLKDRENYGQETITTN